MYGCILRCWLQCLEVPRAKGLPPESPPVESRCRRLRHDELQCRVAHQTLQVCCLIGVFCVLIGLWRGCRRLEFVHVIMLEARHDQGQKGFDFDASMQGVVRVRTLVRGRGRKTSNSDVLPFNSK